MNAYANHVVSYLLAQSWQVALLAVMVGLISLALRNRSAHLRYLLWLIVLAKGLVPPFLTVPLAVLPERSSSPSVVEVVMPEEYSALESPMSVGGAAQPQELKPAVPSLRESAALVWTAGAFFFLLWVSGRAVRYTSWLRDRRRPLPPNLQTSIQELSMGFKFRKWPRIWLLEDISQPFVWGLVRGSVYLPADFVGLSGSDRQRSILAHELSHIARFDAGVNLLQVLAQAAYWFHPLVWWANRKIRQEREKCCDEMAVAHLNAPPEHYTGAIVDTLAAERRSGHPIPSLAIVGSVRDIEERIRTMLKPGKKFHKHPSIVAAAVALLISLVTIPATLVLTARGQAQPTGQNADKSAASGEKPEQPRFAARTFNSKLALDVWFVREGDVPRSIGHTPSAAPLRIPACSLWLAQPTVPVEDWDLLITEMSRNSIPGLKLEPATDSDLRHIAGLGGLQFLDLSGTSVTDAGLAQLKGLTRLEWLDLTGTPVTDAGLAHIKGMTGLQELNLHRTQITGPGIAHLKDMTRLRNLRLDTTDLTDTGLEHLKGLKGLEQLKLSYTLITDAGMPHLKGLTGLRELYLADTRITDEGLAHLKGLTGLKMLSLGKTHITDAGLVHLKDLTRLTWLNLVDTRIRGAGLEHLRGLPDLISLDLSDTLITDAGLEHLKRLGGLRVVWLDSTWVTDAGRQELMKNLPNLSIGRTAQ